VAEKIAEFWSPELWLLRKTIFRSSAAALSKQKCLESAAAPEQKGTYPEQKQSLLRKLKP